MGNGRRWRKEEEEEEPAKPHSPVVGVEGGREGLEFSKGGNARESSEHTGPPTVFSSCNVSQLMILSESSSPPASGGLVAQVTSTGRTKAGAKKLYAGVAN